MHSDKVRIAMVALILAMLVSSGALVGCSSQPTSPATPGTSVSPSTGTSEGAEGDNVQQSPGEESSSVEATAVP